MVRFLGVVLRAFLPLVSKCLRSGSSGGPLPPSVHFFRLAPSPFGGLSPSPGAGGGGSPPGAPLGAFRVEQQHLAESDWQGVPPISWSSSENQTGIPQSVLSSRLEHSSVLV